MFGSDRDVMNHFLKLICSTLEDLEKNKGKKFFL